MHSQKSFKWRVDTAANYKAAFDGRNTLRFPIDATKDITEVSYPEYYDVGLGTKCDGGCAWCYTSATHDGYNFSDPAGKIRDLFGPMAPELRPFQVAIGGSGEPLQHPQFIKVLETFHDLGIVPNYTTNGRHYFKIGIMEATKLYCGGVAVSCHPHMEKEWTKAAQAYVENGVHTALHCIIGNKLSIERFTRVYDQWADKVDYVVLLPMMQVGRGIGKATPDHEALLPALKNCEWSKLAFGAGFFGWLQTQPEIPAQVYPPELFSKYLLLDNPVKVYGNSHTMVEVARVPLGSQMPPIPITP